MRTSSRVAAYLLSLVAVFALALGVGTLAGPFDAPADDHGNHAVAPVGGLADTADGYRLTLRNYGLAAGTSRPVVFTITDPDGDVLRHYDTTHGRQLHLVAVRHDSTGFQHVHPARRDDGSWTTQVAITPGRWRIYVDFAPAGHQPIVLGADLNVTGDPIATTTPDVSRSSVVAGYTVTLTGNLVAGDHSELAFTVTKDGRRVAGLQPYLGAAGHLVALREDDRGYLHVHPDGRGLRFDVQVPNADRYHLYLDFRHGGVVRTAQFALDATGPGAASGDHHHD